MYWVILSKILSALSILVQVLVFGLVVSTPETQVAYSVLAAVALVSQASVALPVLISSQAAWLSPQERAAQFRRAILLAAASALAGGAIAACMSNSLGGANGFMVILVLPAIASLANVYATDRFASGDLKSGAIYNILNVVLPQTASTIGAIWYGNATAWFVGLAVGHTVALLMIVLLWRRSPPMANLHQGEARSTLRISKTIVVSTFCWLIFSWSTLNFPRISLENSQDSIQIVQILLAATMCFAISNAIETLIIQTRRADWLGYVELKKPILFTNNIKNEKIIISIIFMLSGFIGSIFVYLSLSLIQSKTVMISHIFVLFISLVESSRGAISTLYIIAECERKQRHLFYPLAFLVVIYCAIFSIVSSDNPKLSYMISAVVMCISLGFITVKSANHLDNIGSNREVRNG